jgi:DNA-binding NarL/FixJ family response regulator
MVRRVLEAGARGYVLKSDMAMQLVKAVKDVARGKTSLTPKVSEIVLEGFLRVSAESREPKHPKARPTPREKEIIRLLAEGKANKEIASMLGITARTVETHRTRIMMKMGFRTLTDLIHFAIREKIVPTPKF